MKNNIEQKKKNRGCAGIRAQRRRTKTKKACFLLGAMHRRAWTQNGQLHARVHTYKSVAQRIELHGQGAEKNKQNKTTGETRPVNSLDVKFTQESREIFRCDARFQIWPLQMTDSNGKGTPDIFGHLHVCALRTNAITLLFQCGEKVLDCLFICTEIVTTDAKIVTSSYETGW